MNQKKRAKKVGTGNRRASDGAQTELGESRESPTGTKNVNHTIKQSERTGESEIPRGDRKRTGSIRDGVGRAQTRPGGLKRGKGEARVRRGWRVASPHPPLSSVQGRPGERGVVLVIKPLDAPINKNSEVRVEFDVTCSFRLSRPRLINVGSRDAVVLALFVLS